MKNKLLILLAVFLAVVIGGCTASSDDSVSGTNSSVEHFSEFSIENVSGTETNESAVSEETPVRDALTADEYERLDAYLTALEEANPDVLAWGSGYRKDAPVFLGVAKNYALCEWGYYAMSLDDVVLPEGMDADCDIFPHYASQCGVYLIGEDEILKLEDALGEVVSVDEVYALLPRIVQYYVENLYYEATPLTGEERARLDAYLTALEQESENMEFQERCEPVLCGTVGDYTLCTWGYETGRRDPVSLESHLDISSCPVGSKYGAYLIGGDEIIPLEDALGDIVTLEEVYDLLTPTAKYRIDRLNKE